ncbi:MAG: hypothetical protein Q7J73_09635 [Dehalococcoidales bacterium]|nr:hypothetical protein [Dehalococcoidales bacterium]
MMRDSRLLKRVFLSSFVVAFVLIVSLVNAAPVLADGGIAMSGSFYQQAFEIPQGSSVSGPDIYVVVFNNSSDPFKVKMTTQAPAGVSLVLSKSEFTLPASGQQMILVGVEVGTDAVPGKYEISVVVEPYKETVTGIQLVGAASQKASLVVLGESGMVSVQTTSPDKQPIAATIRLYRVVSGQDHEVAYSEKGTLEVKVAPGSFVAASFVGGMKLAEERFDVAAGESKQITLSGATVYFEGFDIVPNYQKQDGKLAFVQIVYTVKNLYQRVEKGEVFLQVSYSGGTPTEMLLATLSPLETGRVGLNYNYIPDGGWAKGNYDFTLRLNLDGKPYASSLVKTFVVSGDGSAKGNTGGISSYAIGGIVVGVIVVAIIAFLLFRRMTRRN